MSSPDPAHEVLKWVGEVVATAPAFACVPGDPATDPLPDPITPIGGPELDVSRAVKAYAELDPGHPICMLQPLLIAWCREQNQLTHRIRELYCAFLEAVPEPSKRPLLQLLTDERREPLGSCAASGQVVHGASTRRRMSPATSARGRVLVSVAVLVCCLSMMLIYANGREVIGYADPLPVSPDYPTCESARADARPAHVPPTPDRRVASEIALIEIDGGLVVRQRGRRDVVITAREIDTIPPRAHTVDLDRQWGAAVALPVRGGGAWVVLEAGVSR